MQHQSTTRAMHPARGRFRGRIDAHQAAGVAEKVFARFGQCKAEIVENFGKLAGPVFYSTAAVRPEFFVAGLDQAQAFLAPRLLLGQLVEWSRSTCF
jgi:hypothetical protein